MGVEPPSASSAPLGELQSEILAKYHPLEPSLLISRRGSQWRHRRGMAVFVDRHHREKATVDMSLRPGADVFCNDLDAYFHRRPSGVSEMPEVPVNVMDQYRPRVYATPAIRSTRTVTNRSPASRSGEIQQAYRYARDLRLWFESLSYEKNTTGRRA
jgi:hypothetical protein